MTYGVGFGALVPLKNKTFDASLEGFRVGH